MDKHQNLFKPLLIVPRGTTNILQMHKIQKNTKSTQPREHVYLDYTSTLQYLPTVCGHGCVALGFFPQELANLGTNNIQHICKTKF